MSEVIEGEIVHSSLAVSEAPQPPAPPSLFGTTDPVEVVERAVRVADALKAVVVSKKLIANIQGKEYPQVEAWLTLAAMLRLTTICEWSRPVEGGWEARVFVRDATGAVVGAAEAQCLSTERSKKSWESYALRSMAQTRATSKALRSLLGFIMVLSGFQPTPAEEMEGVAVAASAPQAEVEHGPELATKPQLQKIARLFGLLQYSDDERRDMAEMIVGKRSAKDLTRDEAATLIEKLNAGITRDA